MKKGISYLRLISQITMLVLVLTMAATSTFSWYDRYPTEEKEGKLLSYTQTGKVNNSFSTGRTVQTYAGTNDSGKITFSSDPVSGPVPIKKGEPCYFKTVIRDTVGVGDSIVSLYISQIHVSQNVSNTINIGLVGQEKTYEQYSGNNYSFDKVCLEDNIYLSNNGTATIVWFIKTDANFDTDETVTLDAQYLVYN